MDTVKKQLPIGIEGFEEIMEEGYYFYRDKCRVALAEECKKSY